MELDPSSLAPGQRIVIRELDRVTLARDVVGDEGQPVPAGSTGTVVAVWSGGAAFDVEFGGSLDALATVEAVAISAVTPARD